MLDEIRTPNRGEEFRRQRGLFEKYLNDESFIDFLLDFWIMKRMNDPWKSTLDEVTELEAHKFILNVRGTPTPKMIKEAEQTRIAVQNLLKEMLKK